MDERQLKDILSSEEIPAADENARKRATNLALAAFDEAQREKEKKRQGFRLFGRLTDRLQLRSGRRLMNKPYLAGGMAVVLLGVVTYGALDAYRKPELSNLVQGTSQKDKGADVKEADRLAQLNRPADPAPRTDSEKKERRVGGEKSSNAKRLLQAKPDQAIAKQQQPAEAEVAAQTPASPAPKSKSKAEPHRSAETARRIAPSINIMPNQRVLGETQGPMGQASGGKSASKPSSSLS
ncbi:MAG: hypothetical protein ACR2OX_12755, partial [Methyloligellaceae bacterium]